MIVLKAKDEPMLMGDRRLTMTRLVQSAFSGTVNRELTWQDKQV